MNSACLLRNSHVFTRNACPHTQVTCLHTLNSHIHLHLTPTQPEHINPSHSLPIIQITLPSPAHLLLALTPIGTIFILQASSLHVIHTTQPLHSTHTHISTLHPRNPQHQPMQCHSSTHLHALSTPHTSHITHITHHTLHTHTQHARTHITHHTSHTHTSQYHLYLVLTQLQTPTLAASILKPLVHASPILRNHHSIISVSHSHDNLRTTLHTIAMSKPPLHSSSTLAISTQSADSHLDLALMQ